MHDAPHRPPRLRPGKGLALLCCRVALFAALLAGAQSLATAAEESTDDDDIGEVAAVTRFIETFVADAVAILSDRALAPEARDEAFRAMLLAGFDTYGGARFVLGRGWRVATRDQAH
jgi:hypothetical protein